MHLGHLQRQDGHAHHQQHVRRATRRAVRRRLQDHEQDPEQDFEQDPSKRKGVGGGGLLTSYEVQGTSYDPSDGGVVGLVGDSLDACVAAVSRVCVMCNESTVELKDGQFRCAGEPTEGALKVLAEKIGVADSSANAKIVKLRSKDPAKGCQGVANTTRRGRQARDARV